MAGKKSFFSPILQFMKTLSGEDKKGIAPVIFQNVFGFYSPTGGTGVTTFIANLAAVLATYKKVAILDLDLYYPSLFMYFMEETDDDTSLKEDILDKFLAQGSDITGYGHVTKVPNVTLFSSRPDNDITRYCSISYDGVKNCIRELSNLYDYVLIDINGTLNDEHVIAAIESSTRVYSFIRSNNSDIERICKDTDILRSYSFGAKTQNIIMSPVTETRDPKELAEYGLNLVMSIPYTKIVEQVGYNFDLFVNVDKGSNKAAQAYIKCCQYLAERIVNYGYEREVTGIVTE